MILAKDADARRWLETEVGLDGTAFERLDRLAAMLAAENTQQNLISAGSLPSLWVRHIADSAQLLRHVPRETPAGPWLDLGSGAGFPGLVIAICRPEWPVVLVESRTRRIAWLNAAVQALGLAAAQISGARLESVASFPASVISARAFAPLPKLLDLSARFSTPATTWVLPKGRGGGQELAQMSRTIRRMFHVEPSVTDPEAVVLVGHGTVKGPRGDAR